MNADEILARAFADHQDEAPDPEVVLAGVHTRLARRRRTIPVLAAAATVAAIAIGAAVLVDQRHPAPPVATTPTPTSTSAPAFEPDKVAIDSTWLPTGTARTTLVATSSGRQYRTYDVTGADRVVTSVLLQLNNWADLRPSSRDASRAGYQARDLTVDGRPAREYHNDSGREDWTYTVVVDLPGDRVAQVQISVPLSVSGRGTALAAIGRRVAGSLRLDRAEPIDTGFRPTYLPRGLAVQAVARGDNGTKWVLTAPGDPSRMVEITQQPRAYTPGTLEGTVTDGRPVQGRPTHVTSGAFPQTLWIDLLRPGVSIQISSTSTPLAELYKIADGIRV